MHMPNVARPKTGMLFSIGRREILEQFYFVTARRFHYRKFQFGSFHAGNLFHHFAGLVRAVRKLKPEHVPPEFECAFEIRHSDAGVVCGRDAKFAHALKRGTRSPLRVAKLYSALPILINIGQGTVRSTYFSAAMTFSSIAIGVGSAVTSTVVRVGFGLPSPAKYSA